MGDVQAGGGRDARDSWAMKMQQRYAVPVYHEYWDIDDTDIVEVDKRAEREKAARVFDTDGGTDKAVTPSTGMRHVAQRFRTRAQSDTGYVYETDFSIRSHTYSSQDTEYDKLMNAWRHDGNVPSIYTFGITNAFQRTDALESGFKDFYFIDLRGFLDAVDSGRLDAVSAHGNGDGSRALYFSVDSLREAGLIRDEIHDEVLKSAWHEQETSDDFPTAPGVGTDNQMDLNSFNSGGTK
jgi:hypothetical protein